MKNKKMSDEKYRKMYDKLVDYQENEHIQNQKKIKIGIRLFLIIPILFLFLLFSTNSNKVIFLVLWIVSLFILSCYLIIVEYRDYTLQHDMSEIRGEKEEEFDSLISMDESKLAQMIEYRTKIDNEVEEKS